VEGERIVCVANFRPEKNIVGLIDAFHLLRASSGRGHLILVGSLRNRAYAQCVHEVIAARSLSDHVTVLGEREDVPALLGSVDIGVLASTAEGMPLTLIQYGLAALPVVVTEVGECPEAVAFGEAGLVVKPSDPGAMARALESLLANPSLRKRLGAALRDHVQPRFSRERSVAKVLNLYERLVACP
jgi:glycosyltransferase involved in cell wall biosynthesis